MEIVDHIAETPLFNGLPQEQLDKLARIAVEKKYRKGQTLFAEGSKAIGLFVIISGKIKVYKLSLEGKEQILHIFARGELLWRSPHVCRRQLSGPRRNPGGQSGICFFQERLSSNC